MAKGQYLNANEAATELGISLATLYAYVSRGLIRSEQGDGQGNHRSRRYRWEDVQALKNKREIRHNPSKAAETALHWGIPIMESSITLIEDGRLFYRGYDVSHLALHHAIEEVAALIWTGSLENANTIFDTKASLEGMGLEKIPTQHLTPIERFQVLLPLVGHGDIVAYDLRPAGVVQSSARILQTLIALAAQNNQVQIPLAEMLQKTWVPHDPAASYFLNMGLVLCADHELNVSAFTARCVASAGATPYQVVLAGLAALQGVKHGGLVEHVDAFFREAGDAKGVKPAMIARIRRGEHVMGFGHRLYPSGDPRGRLLYETLCQTYPKHPAVEVGQAMVEAAQALIGEEPTIDFALALMGRILNLPFGTGIAIFALGRTIGWMGHAIEQYTLDQIIRPRARYVGDLPKT